MFSDCVLLRAYRKRTTLAQLEQGTVYYWEPIGRELHSHTLEQGIVYYWEPIGRGSDYKMTECTMYNRRRRQRSSPGEMSGIEPGAKRNPGEAVPISRWNHQSRPRRHHRLPAVDWSVTSQWQCATAGGQYNNNNNNNMHERIQYHQITRRTSCNFEAGLNQWIQLSQFFLRYAWCRMPTLQSEVFCRWTNWTSSAPAIRFYNRHMAR